MIASQSSCTASLVTATNDMITDAEVRLMSCVTWQEKLS